MQGNIICACAPAIKALISAYFSETKGTTPLGSLIGQKGTANPTVNMDINDWPLKNEMVNFVEKPMMVIEEKPPTPPPKDNYKGWGDGPYGGITVTERYSVVSTPNAFANGRRDGSRKGRKVLGV
jgi:hypothetical protein